MKKIHYILITAASLLLLPGCLKESGPTDADLITIEASIGPQTKVNYEGNGSTFVDGDKIAVYAWTGSASPVPEARAVDGVVNTLGDTGWSPASLMRWKSMSDTHYFLGVSPVHSISNFTEDPFTLVPDNYTASDLLVATTPAGIAPTKNPISLEFSHLMAKLVVNLTFRSQWSSAPTVTSVTVNSRKTGTVNYLAKEVTATGTASDVALTKNDNASWSGLQIPQDGVTTITVRIGDKDYVYTHSTGIPLSSGYYTTINLNVGRDKIELDSGNITISDWESGTPIEGSTVRSGGPFSLDAYFPADLLPGRNGWQNGDEIFVLCQVEGKSFVDNTDVKYLKMTYDGTAWTVAEMQNGTATPGCLGLTDGDQVSMRAVYLPYGQDVSVTADGKGGYAFNGQTYDCYMTAPLSATVSGGALLGSFDLSLSEGVMLFSMENDNNYSGTIELREPHLTPLGLKGLTADLGAVSADPVHGAPVQGHAYGGTSPGYAFYATPDADLNNVWADYHFTQLRGAWDSGSYYGYDKHLCLYGASSRVLALPALGSSDWKSLTYKPIDLGCEIDDPVRGGKKRVYWATCNVGANKPEEYGDYFAWGETEPYYSSLDPLTWKGGKGLGYAWASYFDTKDGGTSFTKYNDAGPTVLETVDDAATANWGAPWRMPTAEDWSALYLLPTSHWVTNFDGSGINGYEFSGNGATIFLPAAGYRYGTTLDNAGSKGNYWSSSIDESLLRRGSHLIFDSISPGCDVAFRYRGLSVRPVTD